MNPVKRVTESTKPKGIVYVYSCGHTHFMSQQEVHDFVYGDGPEAPKFCMDPSHTEEA